MLPDEARPAPRAGAALLIELAAGKCTSATALPDQVASGCCGGMVQWAFQFLVGLQNSFDLFLLRYNLHVVKLTYRLPQSAHGTLRHPTVPSPARASSHFKIYTW